MEIALQRMGSSSGDEVCAFYDGCFLGSFYWRDGTWIADTCEPTRVMTVHKFRVQAEAELLRRTAEHVATW